MSETQSSHRPKRLSDHYRAFWHQSPYKMAGLAFLLGLLPFVMVAAGGLGGLNFQGIMDSSLLVRQDSNVKITEVARFRERTNDARENAVMREPVVQLSDGVYLVDTGRLRQGSGQASDGTLSLGRQEAAGQTCLTNPFPASCQVFYIKNVGFMAALNWSVQFLLLFPVSIFFAFRIPQLFSEAVRRMHEKGMLKQRNGGQEPIALEGDVVHFIRDKIWRRALGCGLVLMAGIVLVMWYDWDAVVNTPLDCHQQGWPATQSCQSADLAPFEDSRENELDWSISAIFPSVYQRHYGEVVDGEAKTVLSLLYAFGCTAEKREDLKGIFDFPIDDATCLKSDYRQHYRYAGVLENSLFSGYVYLVATILSALVLMFYGYLFCFAWTIEEVSRRKYPLMVVPNLRSNDLRRGFELLWPPVRAVIIATFVGYAVLYLMRIQNLFLRAQDYRDIFDFMARDLLSPMRDITLVVGKFLGGDEVGSLSGQISSTPETLERILDPGLNDTQAYFSVVLFAFVTVIVSILLVIALHDVASRAKQDVIDDHEEAEDLENFVAHHDVDKTVQSQSNEKKALWILSRVSDMRTWPLDWPSLNRALKLLLTGILFLIFYRAMLIWIGIFIYAIVSGRAAKKGGSS